jgi:acyl-CoA synthetase (AMP-forming)/AMP-acid ligase II
MHEPEDVALWDGVTRRSFTYRQLASAVSRLSTELTAVVAALPTTDPVIAFVMDTSIELVLLELAAAHAGIAFSPLGPSDDSRATRLRSSLTALHPVVVYTTFHRKEEVEAAVAACCIGACRVLEVPSAFKLLAPATRTTQSEDGGAACTLSLSLLLGTLLGAVKAEAEKDGCPTPNTPHTPTATTAPAPPHSPSSLPAPPSPTAGCFSVFTSGTTGTPKRINTSRAAFAAYLQAVQTEYAIGPGSRVLLASSPTFDPSIGDTFMAVAAGATLHGALPSSAPPPPPPPIATNRKPMHRQRCCVILPLSDGGGRQFRPTTDGVLCRGPP